MQSTAKNQAYQRGLKAAGIWKSTKNRLKQWDATCVAWATKHHLPELIGHIPVVAGIVLFVSGVLLGGAILSAVLIFAAGLASVMSRGSVNRPTEQSHGSSEYIDPPPLDVSKETDYFDLSHPHNDPNYHGCPYGGDVKNYN
ncbi:hypothetical protein [Pectobacterium peruviense]|uniref:DUF3742 domain-containing protein n=1 Tax=Pectobacterium peruviense TaxID=2066479 RepID=A0ABX4S8Y5_9GAMM|nr:hypothetical protein [Pectobacterium peruviense]KML70036.1 hypothetical protein G033_02915 [Pectobacterium peruviense]PKX82798.1 hypothetical protein A0G02_13805 [Pectobacterium peruviense]PKX87022.1 hypothetical protein A0G03_08950 [Pectobacterium peruviense]